MRVEQMEIGKPFKTARGRVGRLLQVTPSSAIVAWDAPPKEVVFKTKWGDKKKFKSTKAKHESVSLGMEVEPIDALPKRRKHEG